MKKILRTSQAYLPGLGELKFRGQHILRSVLRLPFERDFYFLQHFTPHISADFLDIGANRGQTIQAIRMFNNINKIISFEPSPRAFEALRKNVTKYQNLEVNNFGLGARNGGARLYTPVYRGFVFDGLASTIKNEAQEWLNENRMLYFNKKYLHLLTDKIHIRSLDSLKTRPAFIKVDVQGNELAVLQGGRRTIEEHLPIILLESPQMNKEIAFLAHFGYETYRFSGSRLHRGELGSLNTFLIPERRLKEIDSSLVE